MIDQFKSLVVNRRFFKANDFELKLALNMDNLNALKVGNTVRINGVFYYVNYAAVDDIADGLLTVRGMSLFGLTNNRIVWENYSKQARPEFIARELITRHVTAPSAPERKIKQITVGADSVLSGSSIQYQNSYGIVKEEVEKLCETYDFGFKEEPVDPFVPASNVVFYKGRDLSQTVEFTTDAENVLSESYESSDYDQKNVALVAGEGEGTARTLTTVGTGSGIDRKELYVDARDLQSENDDVVMSPTEYQQALANRGNEKLAEQKAILLLDGDINIQNQLYEYGVDYDLGDTVRRSSPLFGLTYNAQITEITEIYENGLQIVPTFGKRSPTLIDMIKRK